MAFFQVPNAHVTHATMVAAMKRTLDEVEKMLGFDKLPDRRVVKMLLSGRLIKVPIHGVWQHVRFQYMAIVKSVLLRERQLEKLWCEDSLIADPTAILPGVVAFTFDADLVEPLQLVRQHANNLLTNKPTADSIRTILNKRSADLVAVDDTLQLESALFFDMMGPRGQELLTLKILGVMASIDKSVKLADFHQQLGLEMDRALFDFVDDGFKNQVKNLHEVVGDMMKGGAPKLAAKATETIMRFHNQLLHFFEHAGTDGVRVTGETAMNALLPKLAEVTTLDNMEKYVVFAWLANSAEQILIHEKSMNIISTLTQPPAAAAESSDGAVPRVPEVLVPTPPAEGPKPNPKSKGKKVG